MYKCNTIQGVYGQYTPFFMPIRGLIPAQMGILTKTERGAAKLAEAWLSNADQKNAQLNYFPSRKFSQ